MGPNQFIINGVIATKNLLLNRYLGFFTPISGVITLSLIFGATLWALGDFSSPRLLNQDFWVPQKSEPKLLTPLCHREGPGFRWIKMVWSLKTVCKFKVKKKSHYFPCTSENSTLFVTFLTYNQHFHKSLRHPSGQWQKHSANHRYHQVWRWRAMIGFDEWPTW